MGDGTKFAVAILILFLAMVAFFFAFHPGGVQGIKNPDDVLEWLMGEFQNTSSPSVTAAQVANLPDIPGGNTPDVPGVNEPSSQQSPSLPPATGGG
jgi:hypothetical protein